ncbi:hypothetical protein D910_07497 [Dendroctonus ponderosae]|uniref:Uncharacterized protein n=1 Tax=Dendroctonus ponderosae TaxID=77166 RepID=U4UCU1_DENPD|nr:hypothetical protein D910_07497 [Dendroctonus ponderosae]
MLVQIPVQIQVPQHTIQISNSEDDGNQASTVVLPAANESMGMLPN